MSLRALILFSPFVLAVILGRAASIPDEPNREDKGPMYDFSLKHFEWTHRPILLFAPSPLSSHYLETMVVLNRNPDPLADRDVILIEVFEDGTSRAGGREIPDTSAVALRERFEIEPDEFALVLVGKDGTEKNRWEKLPPLNEVFGTIDAMPMRQREIERRKAGGPR